MIGVLSRFLSIWLLVWCSSVAAQAPSAELADARPRASGFWGSVSAGVATPVGHSAGAYPDLAPKLTPAGVLSLAGGAGLGPCVVGARLDWGFGAVAPDGRRGAGYLFALGPFFRATLLESRGSALDERTASQLGLATVADVSWMRVGTSEEDWCPGDDVCEETFPNLGLHALTMGAGLQLITRHIVFEVRYQRPYWYRIIDSYTGLDARDWKFMRSDQWMVTLGGFFDARLWRRGRASD